MFTFHGAPLLVLPRGMNSVFQFTCKSIHSLNAGIKLLNKQNVMGMLYRMVLKWKFCFRRLCRMLFINGIFINRLTFFTLVGKCASKDRVYGLDDILSGVWREDII